MPAYNVETLSQLASAGNEFFASLLEEHYRIGGLTAKQIAYITERPVHPQQPLPLAAHPLPQAQQEPEASRLERAFQAAVRKGVTQPIIRLHGFRFMLAGERAKPENRGALFVTSTTQGEPYLGKVLRGTFYPASQCTPALAHSIRDAIDEPYKAATEYGHMTGQCSVCARPLSNPKSIELGIGPVCRAKFGW